MWLIVIKGQKKYQLNENIICQRTFPPMIEREREYAAKFLSCPLREGDETW